MARCETCGNDYDKAFQVSMNGTTHTETLSLVMIFCEGICIVTVRKDTRTICWMGMKMSVSPGPRTPSNFPRKNTTPRSYCRRTRSEPIR